VNEIEPLLQAHGPLLGRIAASYAAPGAEREDLLQNIALALLRAMPRFRGESSERTYLIRIAHNCGLQHHCRHRPSSMGDATDSVADRRAGPGDTAARREERERLEAAVRDLPLGLRQPLTLWLEELGLREVGEVLGLNKEKRLVDLLIGVENNYKWKGTSYDTYQTSAPWINELASNELVDWTDVDAAEQLFADILDPNTGEPVLVQPNTVLVAPAYRHAAHRVFQAAELTFTAGSTATAAVNPLSNYRVEQSRLMYRRIIASGETAADAKKWWFVGDLSRALAYMENWPITVTQAPQNSEADFSQDIVMRFKVSERGAAAIIEPRAVVKSTAA